ncbi:MAG: TetR/AcrR family transcriptional regulator [Acidobacteriota bacterium]
MAKVSSTERYHHGNLKAVLLKAAFKMLGKVGLEAFTLREVALRAGVSHNAPYRHFKSKEDLIAALATESFRQLHKVLEGSTGDISDPAARVHLIARAYLEFALENPARFDVMFHSSFTREQYPEYIAAYTDAWAVLSKSVDDIQNLILPQAMAGELLWAGVHGIVELGLARRLRHGLRPELEVLVDASVDSLLVGMLRPC